LNHQNEDRNAKQARARPLFGSSDLQPKRSFWREILMSDFFDYRFFSKRNGFFAVGLCCLVLAVYNFLAPPQFRPSGGRWGWLFGFLWDYFGDLGGFYYWLMMCGICFVFALVSKK
jgi:hypothetical protein